MSEATEIVQTWLDWLDERCSVKDHKNHVRHACRESRERALIGSLMWERPKD